MRAHADFSGSQVANVSENATSDLNTKNNTVIYGVILILKILLQNHDILLP